MTPSETLSEIGAPVPTVDALKAQAKRLRAAMQDAQTPITHAQALEAVARQWGFRDWNTLSAKARSNRPRGWHVGQAVSGLYLGHAFTGRLKAVRAAHGGYWYITVVFDTPVDVVESAAFNSYRRQVNALLTEDGVTTEKLSNGTPHMQLRSA